MNITFDLDDTLIPTTAEFSCGSERLSFPLNIFFRERLRVGAPKLLKELGASHEISIYTTSLRSEYLVKSWFWFWGVRISRVVNHQRHTADTRGTEFSGYSKAPKLYEFEILVDDQKGVAIECEKQGKRAIIVGMNDVNWAEKIKSEVQR